MMPDKFPYTLPEFGVFVGFLYLLHKPSTINRVFLFHNKSSTIGNLNLSFRFRKWFV